jgi:class 3 adenylate cyclase
MCEAAEQTVCSADVTGVDGKIRYARSGDVSLAFRTDGDGPIDVVVVPGFVSHVEALWDPLVRYPYDRLSAFSRLITFDKRGQGLSDRTGDVYTLEHVVDDIAVVMDAAGSDRAAIFGISEGGAQAALFAATHPERTSALVLWGTYARRTRAADFPHGLPEGSMRRAGEMFAARWGDPVGLHAFAPSVADDPRFRDWWARFLRSAASPGDVRALFETYEDLDVRAALPAVSAPTLVVHRRDDIISPIALARPYVELIRGARLVEFPGVDHFIGVGDADSVLDEIEQFLTGELAAREPERILATVLFTDIVASTQHAAELGDRRWRSLLEQYDRLIREAIERHHGRVVKSLGDGHLATFDSPARGIRAAVSIRAAMGDLRLEVRAGLHAGECELIGDDLAGLAVHIGARVGALAAAGEILVSSTVKDLVIGSGFAFEDSGVHTLNGIPGAWGLYALESD